MSCGVGGYFTGSNAIISAVDDVSGSLFVAVITTALIAGIELTWRFLLAPRGTAHEVGRKAHHIGIGLIATFMPVWISRPWIGFLLAIGFGSILLISYRFGLLKSLYNENPARPEDPIYRKFRHSWIGPATFSIAVALTSAFFWQTPTIYRAALLILTLGDSAATVCGGLFGRNHYLIFGTRRSLQGNAALLVLASLVCAGTLAPTGALDRALGADVIAASVLFGLLLCLTETISPFGLDNLTLPLMTAVVMISLVDQHGRFAITGDTVLAFALVASTALLFTQAHLEPRQFHAAALMLGVSTVVLLDMKRVLFTGILLVFLACTLLANWLAAQQQLATRRVGVEILGQVAPCVLFMLLREVWPSSGMAVGSLACVCLLAARWWHDALGGRLPALGGAAERAASWRAARWRALVLQGVLSSAGAVAAVLVGSMVGLLWSPGERAVTLVTVATAATAGGLATSLAARPGESADSFLEQVVPGMVAVSAIPAVAALVLGLVG